VCNGPREMPRSVEIGERSKRSRENYSGQRTYDRSFPHSPFDPVVGAMLGPAPASSTYERD
jgi:hypothetical protein